MYVPTLSADQLPRWMADDDNRGRVVEPGLEGAY